MRILIHSVPPWAHSGYGTQCAIAAEALLALGHQVAVSAYAGVHEERDWRGAAILGTGGKAYGNGVIAGNYRRWRADLLIVFCDMWTLDPGQFAGLHVMPWVPVDTDRLGLMDARWLGQLERTAASLRPVAMSDHGRDLLAKAGFHAVLVPHAVGAEFYPDPDAGQAWRESLHLPAKAFVIAKVGVNNEDDRKSFGATLQAFAALARRRKNAYLYLHTEPQVPKAPNLAIMADQLGLRGRVSFARDYERACDLYTSADMRAIYSGASVLDAATKGEGFGVPVIEALACGTPVIACHNSAMPEKIAPAWGWLIGGQKTWARHHNAWWTEPGVTYLERAYHDAMNSARSKRAAAAAEGARWTPAAMRDAWQRALGVPVPPADHGKIFAEIYNSRSWGPGSGPGSDPAACGPYIRLIESYLHEHSIQSVLDLGCGDGRLARAINWGGAHYTGLDVVTGHDIRTCDLPDADLVLVKDVFQHWPNADIAAMRDRLAAYPRALITNTTRECVNNLRPNSDIAAGQWRGVDLAAEPFRWPVREVLEWELPGEVKATVELLSTASPART